MNAFAWKGFAENFLEYVINGAENKIDNFDGRIDNAEPFDGQRRGGLKKFFVEFDDNFLPVFSGGSDFATFAHGVIKFLELFGGIGNIFPVEDWQNVLEIFWHRIILDERIIFKESRKDGARDEMLSEHVISIFRSDF